MANAPKQAVLLLNVEPEIDTVDGAKAVAVLKQAKSVPAGFYKSLDALVDRNSGRAARELAEVIDQQPQSYDLNLTLGKLYRQRGENDKAINMHQALLDSPDTVNEKTRAGVVRTRAKLPKRRLG